MATITVTNNTRLKLGLPSPIGQIGPKATVSRVITTSQLENARSSLISLETSGSITFNVSVEGTTAELDTDFMTAEDTEQLVASNPAAILQTTTGPTDLTIGAWADGQGLRRTGATAVGYDIKDRSGPRIIVGNALQGDTLAVCDYLDAGDGVQLQAALTAAGISSPNRYDVYLRPGTITTSVPITVPTQTALRGSPGVLSSRIAGTATNRKVLDVGNRARVESLYISVPVPDVGAAGTEVVTLQTSSQMYLCRVLASIPTALQAANDTLTALVRGNGVGQRVCTVDITGYGYRRLSIARDLTGIEMSQIASGAPVLRGMLHNVSVTTLDIGFDVRGPFMVSSCESEQNDHIGMRLASLTNRPSPIIANCAISTVAFAGMPQYGIVVDTGTNVSGLLDAKISNCTITSTSTELTSTGIDLRGIGDGVMVSGTSIASFPLGVVISATQINATMQGTIRGATTPVTNASGSLQNNLRTL